MQLYFPSCIWTVPRVFATRRVYGLSMKRKQSTGSATVKSKRQQLRVPEYCDVEPQRASDGSIVWPAPQESIDEAKAFLREWYAVEGPNCCFVLTIRSAEAQAKTIIVPDKDSDGLSSGVIVQRTLTLLGLNSSLVDVHLVAKGATIHDEPERASMKEKDPEYVVVLDQGSRPGPPIVDGPDVKCLLIDHHLSDEFPDNALVPALTSLHVHD